MHNFSPQPPGSLNRPSDYHSYERYLKALDRWLLIRRDEIDVIDRAASAQGREDCSADITLSMSLWKTIRLRADEMISLWAGGRVLGREIDQINTLIWSRLGSLDKGSGIHGLTLAEATRLSDALKEQLSTALSLQTTAASWGQLSAVKADIERIRLLAKKSHLESCDQMVQLDQKYRSLEEQVEAGADVAGSIEVLRAQAARFERDLIIASSGISSDLFLNLQSRYEQLVKRRAELAKLIDKVVATVDQPPVYALPDVDHLGSIPEDQEGQQNFSQMLTKISTAMDIVEKAYRHAEDRHRILTAFRQESSSFTSPDRIASSLIEIGEKVASIEGLNEMVDKITSSLLIYRSYLESQQLDEDSIRTYGQDG